MASSVHSCRSWLQRKLPWSNSRQAWEERIGAAVLLAGTAVVWYGADRYRLWQQVFLWSLLLPVVAVLLRRGWLKLLGPLFLYELVRATRRSRYILLRVYVYFILLIYLFVVLIWWVHSNHVLSVPGNKVVASVQAFFFYLLSAHLLLVALVTPGYTAAAIADEKDRRTLEALLATDLRNREIVLSKLAVRLASLAVMLVTGLPILALLQFLGGIEPDLVGAWLIATAITMASLAGLAMLNSVYAKKSRDAILYTYLEVAAYTLLSGASQLVHMTSLAAWTFDLGTFSFTVGDAADWFGIGNPLVILGKFLHPLTWTSGFYRILPRLLWEYTLFHGALAILFSAWAAFRLRAVFLKHASRPNHVLWRSRRRWQKGISDRPMVWKEAFVERGLRFGWFGRILMLALMLATFVPVIEIGLKNTMSPQMRLGVMSYWARVTGALVGCLLLVGVAVRAATSISSERDRLTWDSLLTTPLTSREILFSKWLGSLLSVRCGWVWLGAVWGLGSAVGGLHVLALPLLFLAWMIYAGLLATVGLWFSLVCQTSLRSMIWTLFAILVVAAGFLVLPVYSSPLFQHMAPGTFLVRWLYRFNMGMWPPFVLGRMLLFGWKGGLPGIRGKPSWEIEFALLGLACWAVTAATLWVLLSMQFRRMTGRQNRRRPEGEPPVTTAIALQ
jgi:ABC-type transport system involved in multi-copper enzyme maturation permease subunit